MADNAIGRLHRGNFVFGRNLGRIVHTRRKGHNIDTQKMLEIHSHAQTISIGFRRRISFQVLKCAQKARMGVEPRG